MSDIFISYASEDRDWVIRLADLLQQQGWTVWWDRSIPFGKSFQEVIETALNEAHCVIVVWSKHSVDSSWVSAEADEARNRGILVPLLIDDASPPLVFRQLQTANMADWSGETSDRIYQKLMTDIGSLLAQSAESNTEDTIKDEGKLIDNKPDRMEILEQSIPEISQSFHKTIEPAEYKKTGSSALWGLAIAVVTIVGLIGLWFAGIISDPPTKQEISTPVVPAFSEQTKHKEESDNSRKTEIATKVALYANLFDEAMQEDQLKLAARYVKKANKIAPENAEALRISTEYEAALQLQIEHEQLAQQKKEQEEAEQKARQTAEAEAKAKEQAVAEKKAKQAKLARLARLAAEKQRKEEELQDELRLEEERIQEKDRIKAEQQAAEEAEKERLQTEKKQQEEELAEQQRLKALEEKRKAEEEANRLQKEAAVKENARQKELRRRMLSR